jgi:hypothetical protein
MSQNPYASFNQMNQPMEPPRTSILAILSLVSSLICCIPGLGVLGALLGTVAVFRISGSGGRKSGTGIAIVGIVVGIIVTVVWVFLAMGAASMAQQFTGVLSRITTPLKSQSLSEFKPLVSSELQGGLTDARWKEFRTAVETEIGEIQTPPSSMLEFFKTYGQIQAQADKIGGRQNAMPFPIQGASGWGLFILHMSQTPPTGGAPGNLGEMFLKMTKNIEFIGPSGKSVWLVPPGADGVTPDPVGTGGAISPDAPKAPSVPDAPKAPEAPSSP